MKKKVIAIIVAIVLVCASVGGFLYYRSYKAEQELNAIRLGLWGDLKYALSFGMDGNIHVGRAMDSVIEDTPLKYTEVVFCEEKPVDLVEGEAPDGILIMYPTELTYKYLDKLNSVIEMDAIDPTVHGLSNPVTMSDIVNKRDMVLKLIYEDYPHNISSSVFRS